MLNQYRDYTDTYRYLITNKEANCQTLLDSLAEENNSIVAEEEAAATMVEVNGYYLDILLNQYDTLPSVIELGLTTIAESCPNRFGSAVTRAQSILLQFEKWFRPTNDCREDENRDTDFSLDDDKLFNRGMVSSDFRVYPNPSSGIINIQFSSEIRENEFKTIELFDMAGRLRHTSIIRSSISQINTEGFAPGVYWLRLRSETDTASKRIIIK